MLYFAPVPSQSLPVNSSSNTCAEALALPGSHCPDLSIPSDDLQRHICRLQRTEQPRSFDGEIASTFFVYEACIPNLEPSIYKTDPV